MDWTDPTAIVRGRRERRGRNRATDYDGSERNRGRRDLACESHRVTAWWHVRGIGCEGGTVDHGVYRAADPRDPRRRGTGGSIRPKACARCRTRHLWCCRECDHADGRLHSGVGAAGAPRWWLRRNYADYGDVRGRSLRRDQGGDGTGASSREYSGREFRSPCTCSRSVSQSGRGRPSRL